MAQIRILSKCAAHLNVHHVQMRISRECASHANVLSVRMCSPANMLPVRMCVPCECVHNPGPIGRYVVWMAISGRTMIQSIQPIHLDSYFRSAGTHLLSIVAWGGRVGNNVSSSQRLCRKKKMIQRVHTYMFPYASYICVYASGCNCP